MKRTLHDREALGVNDRRVRLMCVLKAHIKFSIFGNIFLGIEKAVITFSIFKKIFPKMEIKFLEHTLVKSTFKLKL